MRHFIILIAVLATACRVQTAPESNESNAATETPAAPDVAAVENGLTPAPVPMPAPTVPTATAEPAPTPDSEKSPAAAAKVLSVYFAALAARDYGRAYRLWGGAGEASGMSEAAFAASFAKYRIYDGHIGTTGDTEGAAGSSYIEIPATVTGVLARGGGFVLEGPMTLRRVNDVDGSSAAQRRWHISGSGLKPRP